jgi:hypothetical protein
MSNSIIEPDSYAPVHCKFHKDGFWATAEQNPAGVLNLHDIRQRLLPSERRSDPVVKASDRSFWNQIHCLWKNK